MKYLPVREIDTVTNALNFSTPDTHVIGGCDIYTTKAAGTDKKLYRNIENSLELQYESLVRLSASLSPPYRTASDDSSASEKSGRSKRGRTAEPAPEIDLSRASPFGPLSQITARRTFAYLIATLNASHPDYEFSHILRPSDFRKERSLRTVMHNIDSTLQNLRPKHTAAQNYLSPPSLSHSAPTGINNGNDIWSQNMWKLIDKEMGLRHCEKYSYNPEEDPFDGEEGAIWSIHYFFFNKEKRRVCYLYLRGFSVISHSPVHAATQLRAKLVPRKVSSLSVGEGAGKRASFWLSSDYLQRSIDTVSYGEDDDDDDEMVIEGPEDDEIEVPFMTLDDLRHDLATGRYCPISEEDEDEEWQPRHVRNLSEDIGETMELDD
ncbi:Repressor of RNA polymerase III transcription maf1 [Fulvia fulva]|nr:Repressor of RNA polymerase III transcription maf1 [Fulvia fulva]WPV09334.1 Repressor of RNA polymerase III transcription maf1 [Fulvia fulva]WPV24251.1 Repressor of RNA polymerase III transcription maf1 [Fulvia fulva]